MLRKIIFAIGLFALLCLFGAASSISAHAQETAAKIGETSYTSLQEALDDAADGDTVILLKDIREAVSVSGKEITVDFNGKTLTAAAADKPAFTGSRGQLTLKDGTVTGGKLEHGGAILLNDVTKSTLDSMTITGNAREAVRISHHIDINGSGPDTPCHTTINNCQFTENGTALTGEEAALTEQFALSLLWVSADITNTTFDHNQDGLWFVHNFARKDWMGRLKLNLKDSEFTYNNGEALHVWCSYRNDISVNSCKFLNNNSGEKDQVIYLRETVPEFNGKAETTFYYCSINYNQSRKYTILTESGKTVFSACRIARNTAGQAGAIRATGVFDLQVVNSAINNNHATSTSANACSGGIVARTSVNIHYTDENSASSGGYSRAWFTMMNGALYNNTMEAEGGDCDLHVNDLSVIDQVTDAKKMKDGSVDFSRKEWSRVKYGTVVDAGSKIYLDPKGGDDANSGLRSAPVKTLEQAKKLLTENDGKAIVIMNTVSVSGELDLGGKTIERDQEFAGALLAVREDALVITNTVIDGLGYAADEALVTVDSGAALELGEGSVIKRNGYHKPSNLGNNRYSKNGGGIFAMGDVTVKEGAVVSGNTATTGGGILVKGGKLTISGGSIKDNKAKDSSFDSVKASIGERTSSATDESYGGGVALLLGAQMDMTGGVIDGNEADRSGGGIAVGATYHLTNTTLTGDELLTMTGGTVSNNTAWTAGGGILVQCMTKAVITAGDILDNKACGISNAAYHAGGGIYVNGYHDNQGVPNGSLMISDVELGHNTAEGEGGAIAFCGSGSGAVNSTKGTVIHDNTAKGAITAEMLGDATNTIQYVYKDIDILLDDIAWTFNQRAQEGTDPWTFERIKERSDPITIPEKMLGGALYNWMDENGEQIDPGNTKNIAKTVRFKTDATEENEDVKEAVTLAKVRINGNHSMTNGGGIGANGNLDIGETPPDEETTIEPPGEEPKGDVKGTYEAPSAKKKVAGSGSTRRVRSVKTGDVVCMTLCILMTAALAVILLLGRKRRSGSL